MKFMFWGGREEEEWDKINNKRNKWIKLYDLVGDKFCGEKQTQVREVPGSLQWF